MAWPLALGPILRQVNKTTLALQRPQGTKGRAQIRAITQGSRRHLAGEEGECGSSAMCWEPVKCLALKQMGWGLLESAC